MPLARSQLTHSPHNGSNDQSTLCLAICTPNSPRAAANTPLSTNAMSDGCETLATIRSANNRPIKAAMKLHPLTLHPG